MVTAVYLMPGLAASPEIFEFWDLPPDYKLYRLSWKIPKKGESLTTYAKRMTLEIKEKNPVLIGVSFGGILVQEMAKIISVRKLIIISSVKTRYELPRRMHFARSTRLYHLAPVQLVKNIKNWSKHAINQKIKNRLDLYEKYLSVDDPRYLKWAIRTLICWDQEEPPAGIVHIHGDADPVFPFKYISECITISGGTHIMVITKWKWFNENLPRIIEN